MQTSAVSTDALTEELLTFLGVVLKCTQSGVLQVAVELELTLSQLRALFLLQQADHDPALTELAPAVGLSVPATGRVVDALARLGLVARREDEADRRIKRLSLTARGHETLERLADARREGLRAFAEGLGDDERERLSAVLRPILDRSGVRAARPETPTP